MYRLLIIALLFLFPTSTQAAVIFSEIAWMGTETDANDEWIEIYNFSNTPTNIDGWTITDSNSLNINLSGTMMPHAVFVLERTDDSSAPSVDAAIVYTGALVNSGATLTIKDAGGNIQETLVGGDNWDNIGGNNDLKYTAQFTTTGQWVTAEATPGQPNAESNDDIPEEEENDPEPENDSSNSSKSSGGGSSAEPLILPDVTLGLTLSAPVQAYVHQPINLSLDSYGIGKTLLDSLVYDWNFGDLTTAAGKEVTHMYKYPGTYVVVARAEYKRQQASVRHEITVLPVRFSLTENARGDIQVNNDSAYEIDLSGYSIRGNQTLVFPDDTILLSKGTLTIPREHIGGSYAFLLDQENVLVASTMPTDNVRPTLADLDKPITAKRSISPAPAVVAPSPVPATEAFGFVAEDRPTPAVPAESIEIVEAEENIPAENQLALAPTSQIPVDEDKLPYLALIGILSLGILALFARGTKY